MRNAVQIDVDRRTGETGAGTLQSTVSPVNICEIDYLHY